MLKSLDQELRGPWVIHHSAVLPRSVVRWENIPNTMNVFAGPFSLGLLWDSRWYFQSFSLSKIIKWWVVSPPWCLYFENIIVGNFNSPPFPNSDAHHTHIFADIPAVSSSPTRWNALKKKALFADDLRHCIKTFPSYLSKGISFHNRGAQGIVFKALKSNRNSNADIFFLYSGWSSALESSHF